MRQEILVVTMVVAAYACCSLTRFKKKRSARHTSDYFLQEARALAMASAAPSSENRKYTTPFPYQSTSSSRLAALPFVNRLSASLPPPKLIYELPHFWLKRRQR